MNFWLRVTAGLCLTNMGPLGLIPLGAQSALEVKPRATVHILLFDAFGDRIEARQVQEIRFEGKNASTPAGRIRGLDVYDAPYGEYVLKVWTPGGSFAEQEVLVNLQEVWVRLGLVFSPGDRLWPGGGLSIAGSILPRPSAKKDDWWVRAEGVFLNFRRDAPVDNQGRFSIGGLEMGTYVVEVFEGSILRHAQRVEIDPNRPATQLVISVGN